MRVPILFSTLAVAVLVATELSTAARSTSPTIVKVDVSEQGYVMPSVIKGGVVAMRFRNVGTELHEFALGSIDKGHTFAQARRAFEQDKHVAWMHDVAGPGAMTPGAVITITRRLPSNV
jgi:hypothetical protein